MKKDEAMAWAERLAAVAAPLAERLGTTPWRVAPRLVHDEVGDEARWAWRLAPAGWPFEAGGDGVPHRPGLRWEAWFRPGKRPDAPVGLFLVCDGEDALAGLRGDLHAPLEALVKGGKTAGRYKPLAEVEPLASRLDRQAVGLGRLLPPRPDKVEPALAQLLLDTFKPVDLAVVAWREADSGTFASAAANPFAALARRFGTGG
ncbi:MAG: hypothetical protein VKS61_14100 [Candidatus Sericytochromatia bacterium]|nr:hypothetical protein [Candidatus Sericytochromatia bacterium]